jgi:hypothetical protein
VTFAQSDICANDICANDICANDICANDIYANDICAKWALERERKKERKVALLVTYSVLT